MSEELASFVRDCRSCGDSDYVIRHLGNFPKEMKDIIDDPNGEEVLRAGVGLFKYLADLVAKRPEDSLRTWLVPLIGYPGQDHTDLMGPIFDVTRTQLLWVNAATYLDTPTPEAKVELVLNVYFRWYVISIELMRKVLVFAVYCCHQNIGSLAEFRMGFLYRGKDPVRVLKHLDRSGNADLVTQFYRKSLRNALAHGNVIVALPELIALRESPEDFGSSGDDQVDNACHFVESVYRLRGGDGTNDVVQSIVNDFQQHSDSCFQTVRIFFLLYLHVQNRHLQLFSRQWPEFLGGDTLKAMISVINNDPDGMRIWRTSKV